VINKFFYVVLVLLLSGLIVAACSSSGSKAKTKVASIDFTEAKAMIESANPPAVVDVRTPGEFNNELGHIPGARLIPMDLTMDSLSVYQGLENQGILLVCRTGHRSGIVAAELAKAGIKNIHNLTGGMTAWNQNGGAVERDAQN